MNHDTRAQEWELLRREGKMLGSLLVRNAHLMSLFAFKRSVEEEAALLGYEAERKLMIQELMRLYESQRERLYERLQRAFLDQHRAHAAQTTLSRHGTNPPALDYNEEEEDDELEVKVDASEGILIATLEAGTTPSLVA